MRHFDPPNDGDAKWYEIVASDGTVIAFLDSLKEAKEYFFLNFSHSDEDMTIYKVEREDWEDFVTERWTFNISTGQFERPL